MIDVVYLCAGKGIRAGLGYPKQYGLLGGVPTFVHGLRVLQAMPEIDNIVVVCNDQPQVNEICTTFGITKVVTMEGGTERQDSVWVGVSIIQSKYVLVMESARPFVTEELVRRVIHTEGDIVTPWLPCKSSVLHRGGVFHDRERIGEIQTPQKFKTQLLCAAHKMRTGCHPNTKYTDDTQMLYRLMGLVPTVVDGEEQNIKITTPLDVVIARAICESNSNR